MMMHDNQNFRHFSIRFCLIESIRRDGVSSVLTLSSSTGDDGAYYDIRFFETHLYSRDAHERFLWALAAKDKQYIEPRDFQPVLRGMRCFVFRDDQSWLPGTRGLGSLMVLRSSRRDTLRR